MTGFYFSIISCLSLIEIVSENDVKTQVVTVFLQNCHYKIQYTFIMYDCITKYRSHRTVAETQPSSSLLCFDLNVMLVGKFDDVHDVQQEHAVFQSRRLLWICISWAKCGDGGVGEHLPAGSCNNLHCVNRDTLELNKNPCTNTSGGRPSAGHQNVKNECYFSHTSSNIEP